ncbi:MAG: hypothetical protein RLZZ361_347 [Cyanobacteriota bacterium]|jgi:hypothetical protein
MTRSINNNQYYIRPNSQETQVFNIDLDPDLIASLQASITGISTEISQPTEVTPTQPEEETIEEFLAIPTTALRKLRSQPSPGELRIASREEEAPAKPKIKKSNRAKRTYTRGGDTRVTDPEEIEKKTPKIQVPFFERQAIGSETTLPDGTIIQTIKNEEGNTVETTTLPNGASTIKTFEDFQLDSKGNPTGFRTTIVGNNNETNIYSTIINDLGEGIFSTVTTDITDPSNPTHVMSSALKLNATVLDDEGNSLYNSNTTRADGLSEIITHESLSFEDQDSLRRPSGYKSIFETINPNGEINRLVTETISFTDENGKRITVIYDVGDPNNLVEISRTSRSDPFNEPRETGNQVSNRLDQVNRWGLLDITGDEKLDPSSDILLISRYLQGLRGADLILNINLGETPREVIDLEQRISNLLNRGLIDVFGTDNIVNEKDLKILARYMMGARGDVLLDRKNADDDSIKINEEGTNVLTIDEINPNLPELQQIFGVEGKKFEFYNSAGQKQKFRLFFVDTFNPN